MEDTRRFSFRTVKSSRNGLSSAESAVRYFRGSGEPSIADVMSDSIVRQVMARDGVGADQLVNLIENVRSHLE